MQNATYGRDKSGQKKLLANLKGDIASARKHLTGSKYDAVIKNVNTYWSGVDAQKFLSVFKKSVSEISSKMKAYETVIENALNADANQFARMQSTNVGSITKK